jgi:hypothetical protein
MKGNAFGYSCPGCGTREQVRDYGRSSLAACFSGHRAQFCWAIYWVHLGVTFCHCPGFRSGHVPGFWRKQVVAFACGPTSPDVHVIFSPSDGSLRSRLHQRIHLVIPRGSRTNLTKDRRHLNSVILPPLPIIGTTEVLTLSNESPPLSEVCT